MVVDNETIDCPECLGNGYDLDGPQGDDEMEDCPQLWRYRNTNR